MRGYEPARGRRYRAGGTGPAVEDGSRRREGPVVEAGTKPEDSNTV